MARVFIAASYTRLSEAVALRAEVVKRGHVVVSTWLDQPPGEYVRPDAEMERLAKEDFQDVQRSEVVVCLTGDAGGKGGRHAEVGMALGIGKRVIILGPRENIYHWHPAVRVVNSLRRLIEVLA